MDLVALSSIAKAENKKRKKNGKPVGRGQFADLQSAAARGVDIDEVMNRPKVNLNQLADEHRARVAQAPVEFHKPAAAAPVAHAPVPAATRGRLVRAITPKRVAIAALPISAVGGYALFRRKNKTEKPALGRTQMRQISSKM